MCTVCGCGEGETRIEGAVHVHADGTVPPVIAMNMLTSMTIIITNTASAAIWISAPVRPAPTRRG